MVWQEPLDIEAEFHAAGCYVSDAYKRYFHKDKENGSHYQIYLHSNGVCFMTLAPSHPIIKEQLTVKSVDFPEQRLINEVSGKRKRGGQFLQSQSYLCTIKTTNDMTYTVRAAIDGKLVEINRDLITEPERMLNPNRGFIAVLQTKWVNVDKIPDDEWMTEEEFFKSENQVPSLPVKATLA